MAPPKRNPAATPLTEDELEIMRKNLSESEARVHAEAEALQRERDRMERTARDLSLREQLVAEREQELDSKSRKSPFDLSAITDSNPVPPRQPVTTPPMSQPIIPADPPRDRHVQPKISFRDALDTVPYFDGHNVTLYQFSCACRRARDIIPPAFERDLTKLLLNKLRGRAYYAIEEESCETVTDLIDALYRSFGGRKTVDQYRGELSNVHLRPDEHILDFISRVKELRAQVLDMERRTRGHIDPRIESEIDSLVLRSFREGLPFEYRVSMTAENCRTPAEAFQIAKEIANQLENDKRRFRTKDKNYQKLEGHRAAPIGKPLAHSTPQRSGYDNRSQRSTDYSGNNRSQRSPDMGSRNNYRSPNPTLDQSSGRRRESPPQTKFCRYCKSQGHEIEECRKRQFNNSRRQSGNARQPPRTADGPRTGETREASRPVKAIATTSDNAPNESP